MRVGTEVVIQALAFYADNDLAANHECTDINTCRFFDEFLHQKSYAFDIERLHYSLGSLVGLGQYHTIAVRAAGNLYNQRRTASAFDYVFKIRGLAGEHCLWN